MSEIGDRMHARINNYKKQRAYLMATGQYDEILQLNAKTANDHYNDICELHKKSIDLARSIGVKIS